MDEEVIDLIKDGNVGILPTDTLYGLVGQALNIKAVERIYRLKQRAPEKPLIILISSLSNLNLFGINLTASEKAFLQKIWPNPVSVVLSAPDDQFRYLHRGTKTLAFRMPADDKLRNFLQKTGPLVAPSANPEGKSPAQTLEEARQYFKDQVDFYIDGGKISALPSTLIKIQESTITILRQGAHTLPTLKLG